MDMVATTSEMLMLSLAMEVMVMEATPGSAMAMDMDMDMVVKAMATLATAGQATPTMDMEVTTTVMPMLRQAMEDMAMEVTPGSAMVTDMVMAMVATATVTAATGGPATLTMDMVATTSEMLMLSRVMEATAMVATELGATPMCTDLRRDLGLHMDTIEKFGNFLSCS